MSVANSYGNDGMGTAIFLLAAGFLGFLGVQIYLLVQDGQTIGKRIVGIQIVGYSSGSLLGAGRVLGMRGALPGFIAGIPYVGWLFALVDVLFIFGEERRCIHDYMARSKVVTGKLSKSTTAGASETARTDPADEAVSVSSSAARNAGAARQWEGSSSGRTQSESSPAASPSIDRLREVLQNLEELHEEGTITEEKFQQSRRKALADIVEESDADAEAILQGLRHLQEEGRLEEADVQTVKSIL